MESLRIKPTNHTECIMHYYFATGSRTKVLRSTFVYVCLSVHSHTSQTRRPNSTNIFCTCYPWPWLSDDSADMVAWTMVGWSSTALSTQFRSYCAFKVELYYKYSNSISITFWGTITKKENITITVDCYIFLWWITQFFHIIDWMIRIKDDMYVSSSSPGGGTRGQVCHLRLHCYSSYGVIIIITIIIQPTCSNQSNEMKLSVSKWAMFTTQNVKAHLVQSQPASFPHQQRFLRWCCPSATAVFPTEWMQRQHQRPSDLWTPSSLCQRQAPTASTNHQHMPQSMPGYKCSTNMFRHSTVLQVTTGAQVS